MEANDMKAMREALSALIPVAEHGLNARTHSLNCIVGATNVEAARALVEQAKEAIADAKAALAKPPRQCDIGNAEEQSRRFCAFCRPRTEPCDGCACLEASRKGRCEFVWAQMPYEKGGAS